MDAITAEYSLSESFMQSVESGRMGYEALERVFFQLLIQQRVHATRERAYALHVLYKEMERSTYHA